MTNETELSAHDVAPTTDTVTSTVLDEIMRDLDAPHHGVLPVAAIQKAREHRREIIPRLIAAIEQAMCDPEFTETEHHGHFFAVFLLAEFRAQEAFPILKELLRQPKDRLSDLFGDALYNGLPACLAATAGDRIDELIAMLCDPQVDSESHLILAESLAILVAAGWLERYRAVEVLRDRLRDAIQAESVVTCTSVLLSLLDLYPEEAMSEIRLAFEKGLIEEIMVGWPDVEATLAEGKEAVLAAAPRTHRLVDDTIAVLQKWASFRPKSKPRSQPKPIARPPAPILPQRPKAPPPEPRSEPAAFTTKQLEAPKDRVGRNEPCPCGSGKKFKKCCGSRVTS